MKRISFLLLVLMLLMPARAAAIKVDDFKYFDVKECGLPLVNHGFDDAVCYYGRLSASLEGQVRDMVWYLAQNNAGVAVRFRSNATAFAARWTLINDFKMNHMAPTGIGGCDLYGYENGEWRYVGTARPSGKESKAIINSYVDGKMRDYVLFLPLYDGVSSLAIGVNEGAVVEKPEADGLNAFKGSAEKPLVFFGHSGLQGGCASRPGMVYTSILSRMLKRECINLGFSGLGQMYTIMAKEMNKIDADAYILDCLGNNYLQMVRDSSELFVRTILREHPTTPLIFMSSYADVTEWCGKDPESEGPKKEVFVRDLCEKLRNEGYTNVHYLDMHGPREDASNTLIGSSAFGSTEGTVDGGHLTDYGFQQIAEYLYPLFSAPDGLLADASPAKGGLNEINIIPCPNKVEAGRGTFDLQSGKVEYITDSTIPEEGYRIEITPKRAAVSASGKAGFLFAGQTLRQLEVNGGRELQCCWIEDAPRFKYRGVLIDCARHFYPKEEICKVLDIMAYYKLNRLHWHLTDDHGWRIEIKQYPRLVEVGAFGDIGSKPDWDSDENLVGEIRYEGYYTQDDIREVVAYADSLGIVIVPEIDMPGHMTSALAAYNWLGCTGGPYKVINFMGPRGKGFGKENLCIGKEETFTFVENVLKEVVELFPSEYIHIGGDECITERWDNCPLCQKRKKETGMNLQSYFTARVQKILEGYGRKIIGWDEILDGEIDGNAVIMSWRGTKGGINAAKRGMDAIMSPSAYLYLDKRQSKDKSEPKAFGGRVLTVDKVYGYDPVEGLDEKQAEHIIGVQGNLWCDVVCTDEYLEYMLLPRLAALSEVQWCNEGNRDWDRFVRSMDSHRQYYDDHGYVYAKHLWGVAGMPGREHNVYPDSLRVQGGINHVQGIAYDKKEKCFYCSFTTAFYKVSPEGKVLDGIEEIHGHLGALTFDEAGRKVYASLECKDDEIGRNISKGMGKEGYTHGESRFYIAEIDVDNMTMTTHELPEVRDDYLAGRYGCSGIDGVSIAPRFGRKGGEPEYLYVAYGIYGDTSRSDNDYNIILCYRPGNYSKPVRKYFVHTGNTTYGVQNLCYDSFTDRLYMAVYRGKKEAYPNYALFALDMDQKPSKGYLEGVPYEKGKVLLLDSFTGWHQNLGSTGICSMGDGYFYIGVNGKDNGRQVCDFTLYRYSESEEGPLKRGVGEN